MGCYYLNKLHYKYLLWIEFVGIIMKRKKSNKEKVSLWEKVSYSGGDMANCIMFGTVGSYLSYYYTDIVGISVIAVGAILGIVRFVEAMVNFGTGIAIDHLHFKSGKAKPFIYWTNIPLVIMFILIFMVPDWGKQEKIWYAFFSYFLFCVLYAINNTAYGTLLSLITYDVKERRILNSFKVFGSGMGELLVSIFTIPLVMVCSRFGRLQFACVAFLYSIISLILLGNCTFFCQERVGKKENKKVDLIKALSCAVKSRSWILLCIIGACIMMAIVIQNQSMIYYAKYIFMDENKAAFLLTLCTVAQFPVVLIIDKILNSLGNRNCMLFGFGIFIIFTLLMYSFKTKIVPFCVFLLIAEMGQSIAVSPCYAICADAIDEVEELTGNRPQGIMVSFMMCAMKAGTAIAGIMFSGVLHAGNYLPESIQQSSNTITAIYLNMFLFPIIISLVCIVLTLFFKGNLKEECN